MNTAEIEIYPLHMQKMYEYSWTKEM